MPDELTLDDLPQPERETTVAPDTLEVDDVNPNDMTDKQFQLLCEKMQENGWLGGPIITTTDGMIADGEHRRNAALDIGLSEVPVKQYDISEETRRLWRQELNKIRGEHDYQDDRDEIEYLLDTSHNDDVTELIESAGEADEFDDLLDDTPEFDPVEEDEQPELDEKELTECPECGHEFES